MSEFSKLILIVISSQDDINIRMYRQQHLSRNLLNSWNFSAESHMFNGSHISYSKVDITVSFNKIQV